MEQEMMTRKSKHKGPVACAVLREDTGNMGVE